MGVLCIEEVLYHGSTLFRKGVVLWQYFVKSKCCTMGLLCLEMVFYCCTMGLPYLEGVLYYGRILFRGTVILLEYFV